MASFPLFRPVRRADPPIETWRALPAAQQPQWPDPALLREVTSELSTASPLVFVEECDRLRDRLAAVARGEAFLLQGGDCAETFEETTADAITGKLRTILQAAVVLTYAASVPVVKVGRMAGQYAKPRSSATEVQDGVPLPAYRGDAVNDRQFTAEARRPDPRRLSRMYESSATALNLIRAFSAGGGGDLHEAHTWNRDFVADSPSRERYRRLADEIDRSLRFMEACGANPREVRGTEFFASHEGLLLDYEAALTRHDGRTGLPYAMSGHLLWIGERTRDLAGAHVEYFSKIQNPVAVKLGPTTTPDDALAYVEKLDPERVPGRLTFIVRMGAGQVRDRLPALVEKVTSDGAQVVWVCDPMHGNTFEASNGHKTRLFDDIVDEVRSFFEVHHALGTYPGGIHLELTGDDSTECVGGGDAVLTDDLPRRYRTACDPRLNRSQSLDLAFLVAEMLRR